MKNGLIIISIMLLLAGCGGNNTKSRLSTKESREAKALLQGIWLDSETGLVSFRVKGDTIYYPDSMALAACFMIRNDSLIINSSRYHIEKQSEHLLWFRNQNGDMVKLSKSDDPNDVLSFRHEQPKAMETVSEYQKKDSVVFHDGERYHWYVAVNPTQYRVSKTSYSSEGMEVENDYFDNIIHISIYNGSNKIFSRDIRKQMFAEYIDEEFLNQSVLGNIQYESIDSDGIKFNATICIPDGGACYVVALIIGFNGSLSMSLLDY